MSRLFLRDIRNSFKPHLHNHEMDKQKSDHLHGWNTRHASGRFRDQDKKSAKDGCDQKIMKHDLRNASIALYDIFDK